MSRTALLLFLLLPGLAAADSVRYRIDPVHSRVLLRVDHLGFARSMATLSGPVGHIDYDATAPERSRVVVSLPLARVDFGDEDWNRRMAGRAWFDAERHPQAHFASRRIEADPEGLLRIEGDLELRGVRAPVVLLARVNRLGRHPPFANRETLGASATAVVARSAFGMDRHPRAIGDAVELWIEVEAVRERRGRPYEVDADPSLDADDPTEAHSQPDTQEPDHADLQQP